MIKSATVIYDLIDPTLKTDNKTGTASGNSPYSVPVNALSVPNKVKLAYLENRYFKLDGTHIFPKGNENVGWESDITSDENGAISAWVQFVFANTHSSFGIQIAFNGGTIAEDFTIEYFAGDTPIGNITVTGNTEKMYTEASTMLNWNKVKITVTKINNAGQRARISYVVFGVSDEYTSDDLIRVTASRATDLTAEKIDSGECEFQFFNAGRFDIKSIKDLPSEIQQNINIQIYFDNKKFGSYVSRGTAVSDEGKVITIQGYDDFYTLGETYFLKGKIASNKSLYDWAVEVSEDCGINLIIDDSLKNIYSNGYIGYVPHREALRMIAEAGNCIIHTDKYGNNYIAPHTPEAPILFNEDSIIKDTLDVNNSEKIDGVVVERYTYVLSSTATGLAEVQDIALTGEEQAVWVDYATFPSSVDSVAASTNITIDAVKTKYYSDRALIYFTGTANETGWITLIGKAYAMSKTNISSGAESGNIKTISNTLITNSAVAESVLSYQTARTQNIYLYSANVFTEDEELTLGGEVDLNGENIYITKITQSLTADSAEINIVGYDKE